MPCRFHWIIEKCLAGTECPGYYGSEEADIKFLSNQGIRELISLTERPFPAFLLTPYQIHSNHFPIKDFDVPSPAQALECCQLISHYLKNRLPVAIHCLAGLGRTGTILACYLIYQKEDPLAVIERLRQIESDYIITPPQEIFVLNWATYLSEKSSVDISEKSSKL